MKGAIAHTVVYVLVSAFLVAVWAVTSGDSETIRRIGEDPTTVDGSFWPIWPILGWGLAVAIHLAFAVLGAPRKVVHAVTGQSRDHGRRKAERRADQQERRAEQLARRAERHARRSGTGAAETPDPPTLPPHRPIPDVARRAMSEAERLVADLLQNPNGATPPAAASPPSPAPPPAEPAPAAPAAAPASAGTSGTGSAAPRPAVVTVLFTDIVGSTTLNETLGDAAYATMLQDHRRLVRSVIDEYKGREVGTQGDGFLVRFDTPTIGVRAACAIAHAVTDARNRGVFEPRLRMGLHCGEAMEDGEDLVGTVVNLAARVCGTAEPDEILITEPVADRLVGRVHLIDRGLVSLRGLSQRRHLLQVDWNDSAADLDPGPTERPADLDPEATDRRPGSA